MRARNIKPAFYKNADLAECSLAARLLAPALWMLADREGRLHDRPKQIKGECFPYDNIEIEPLLKELEKWGHIIRYDVSGQKYIQIVAFEKHQRPHPNEIPSEIPKVESTSNLGAKRLVLNDDIINDDIRNPDITDVKPRQEKVELIDGVIKVPQKKLKLWSDAYPAINLSQEIAKASAWIMANPKNKKSNYEKFLTNWLCRAQDKAPRFSKEKDIYAGVER